MRHTFQISDNGLSGDVLTYREFNPRLRIPEFSGIDDFAEPHHIDLIVFHFNSDDGLSGNRCFDANTLRPEIQRDIVGKIDDLADLDANVGLYFISGDCRTLSNLNHSGIDIEILHSLFQKACFVLQIVVQPPAIRGLRLVQQINRRLTVFFCVSFVHGFRQRRSTVPQPESLADLSGSPGDFTGRSLSPLVILSINSGFLRVVNLPVQTISVSGRMNFFKSPFNFHRLHGVTAIGIPPEGIPLSDKIDHIASGVPPSVKMPCSLSCRILIGRDDADIARSGRGIRRTVSGFQRVSDILSGSCLTRPRRRLRLICGQTRLLPHKLTFLTLVSG